MRNTHEVMDSLMCLFGLHHRVLERRISELNVHRGQHRLLMHLAHDRTLKAQSELAKRLDVSGATVANMLKSLEENGYISRSASNADGRCNEVSITSAGHEVVERSHAIFQQVESGMFEGFSDEELDRIGGYLNRIRENLRKQEQQ